MSECVVCLQNRTMIHTEPCGHSIMCSVCIVPSLVCSGMRCPICRILITNIPDKPGGGSTVSMMPCDDFPHVGITLKNAPGGVVVCGLVDGDLGSKHLRKGDIITFINNIPAVHHRTMVAIINECCTFRTCITVTKGDKKSKVSSYLRTLALKHYENIDTFHPEWNN